MSEEDEEQREEVLRGPPVLKTVKYRYDVLSTSGKSPLFISSMVFRSCDEQNEKYSTV